MVNYNPYPDICGSGSQVHKKLWIIGTALRDYVAAGKTKEDFAEEYGCDIIMDPTGSGIQDVKFHNDSNETMFMLKYNNDKR